MYVFKKVLQFTDSFENNLNKLFHLSFEEILKQFESEFSDINENMKNADDFLGKFVLVNHIFISNNFLFFRSI